MCPIFVASDQILVGLTVKCKKSWYSLDVNVVSYPTRTKNLRWYLLCIPASISLSVNKVWSCLVAGSNFNFWKDEGKNGPQVFVSLSSTAHYPRTQQWACTYTVSSSRQISSFKFICYYPKYIFQTFLKDSTTYRKYILINLWLIRRDVFPYPIFHLGFEGIWVFDFPCLRWKHVEEFCSIVCKTHTFQFRFLWDFEILVCNTSKGIFLLNYCPFHFDLLRG